jgi:hypothetical protein
MRNFDPMKTRAEQGFDAVPPWLFSPKAQRELLGASGLREISVSNDRGVWTSVERIPSKPMFEEDEFQGERVPLTNIAMDEQTLREQKRDEDHIKSKIDEGLYRSWSETAVRQRINREIKEEEKRYWRKQK